MNYYKKKEPTNRSLFEFTSANEIKTEKENNLKELYSDIKEKINNDNKETKILKHTDLKNSKLNELKLYFPYETIRPQQEELITTIHNCITNKQNLIANAPTGLGKTISALAPAITEAIKKNLKVFFLTSRHTQHLIALKTSKEIQKKFNLNFISTDIIGKKWMCLNPSAKNSNSRDFVEICRFLRKNNSCEFYKNTKKILKDMNVLSLTNKKTLSSDEIIEISKKYDLCPYEISLYLAKESTVIITDYYYIFNENIMDNFFQRTDISLNNSIIIIDEAHNLPNRIREQQTKILSLGLINKAKKEANKHANERVKNELNIIKEILDDWGNELNEQRNLTNYNNKKEEEILVRQEDFLIDIKKRINFELLIKDLNKFSEIHSDSESTYVKIIANFLENWNNLNDNNYIRILRKKDKNTQLLIKNLNPSSVSKDIIKYSYSTILMSGTLQPTSMYRDLLGFDKENTIEKVFTNSFPEENRINLIIPETSTKYERRTEQEFKKIGNICENIINNTPGNIIIFFPSYDLLNKISKHIQNITKTTLSENNSLTKEEKNLIINKFEIHKKNGLCLFAVQSGSFSEGIDLPGDLLKTVVIVGLPLQKPNLEVKQLIKYYDYLFHKGWDYGYIFPAFTKTLQSAGRCIRTETDKGMIIFLDERYNWPNYQKCFPEHMKTIISRNYEEIIKNFFNKN